MAKKNIEIKYEGAGSFGYKSWVIESGESKEIPNADWEHLVNTNQTQDLSVVE